MINLIPPHAKKTAAREYWVRVLSVWGFLLTGVVGIALALLLPSYVFQQLQLAPIERELAQKDIVYETLGSVEGIVETANTIVAQLDEPRVLVQASEVLAEINTAATAGVSFNAFTIQREEKVITQVLVRGVADTRVHLANFRDALERSALFGTASVPISDLAQESNLPFSVTITMSNIRDGHDN